MLYQKNLSNNMYRFLYLFLKEVYNFFHPNSSFIVSITVLWSLTYIMFVISLHRGISKHYKMYKSYKITKIFSLTELNLYTYQRTSFICIPCSLVTLHCTCTVHVLVLSIKLMCQQWNNWEQKPKTDFPLRFPKSILKHV